MILSQRLSVRIESQCFLDFRDECCRAERLREKLPCRFEVEILLIPSGHQQDLHFGPEPGEILGQLQFSHSARHDDIGEQQMDRAGMAAGNAERFSAVAGREDVHSAGLCQDMSAQAEHHAIVIDR